MMMCHARQAKTAQIRTFIQKSVYVEMSMSCFPHFYSHGLAGVMTQDNAKQFHETKPLAITYYTVDFARDPSNSKYFRNRYVLMMCLLKRSLRGSVLKVASEFKDIKFAVADKTVFAKDLSNVCLTGGISSISSLAVWHLWPCWLCDPRQHRQVHAPGRVEVCLL
jgi:hypothetical protein